MESMPLRSVPLRFPTDQRTPKTQKTGGQPHPIMQGIPASEKRTTRHASTSARGSAHLPPLLIKSLSQNLRWSRAKSCDHAGSPGPCGPHTPAQGRQLPPLLIKSKPGEKSGHGESEKRDAKLAVRKFSDRLRPFIAPFSRADFQLCQLQLPQEPRLVGPAQKATKGTKTDSLCFLCLLQFPIAMHHAPATAPKTTDGTTSSSRRVRRGASHSPFRTRGGLVSLTRRSALQPVCGTYRV